MDVMNRYPSHEVGPKIILHEPDYEYVQDPRNGLEMVNMRTDGPYDTEGAYANVQDIAQSAEAKRRMFNRNSSRVGRLQASVSRTTATHSHKIRNIVVIVLLLGFTAYFIAAIVRSASESNVPLPKALVILTSLTVAGIIYTFINKHYGDAIRSALVNPFNECFDRHWKWAQWMVLPLIVIGVILYLALEAVTELRQLQSISGTVFFMGILWLTSKHPDHVNWRPIIWGLVLQFVMGVAVLRWKPGYEAALFVSDEIMKFIFYALEGAAVVFGNPMLMLHAFVFVQMPMLIYLGAVMSILYYLGVTQAVSAKIGWAVQATLGTTAIESIAVASNIFLNGMDVMLMLRQYIPLLTKSEFFCLLVGNHSTVAGFAFPLFVMYGAPAEYLLSAAVMSAPAAIAIAKINYPETEESITKEQKDIQLDKGTETNIAEAAANGAEVAGKTVFAVIVNYIAFIGILGFINATLSWFGDQVGYPELSFQVICSYIFYPLSLLMGVDPSEAKEVGKLVGIKVFATELLAFEELGNSIRSGLSDRSASIATYALSGFSSFSTLAISVGVWNTLIPSKSKEMSANVMRAVICANISCFLTACVSGLLFDSSIVPEKEESLISTLALSFIDIIPSYKSIFGLLPGYNF